MSIENEKGGDGLEKIRAEFDFEIASILGMIKAKKYFTQESVKEKMESNFKLIDNLDCKDPRERADRAATLVAFANEMLIGSKKEAVNV